MAEEQDILAQLEANEEAAAKGRFPWKWILVVVLVAALGGGGYFAWLNFFQPAPPQEQAAPAEQQEAAPAATATPQGKTQQPEEPLGVMVSLDPFIVNLAGSKGKRFLKVTMTLELNAPEVHAEVNENKEKIIDSILVLLSSKTFEEVYSVQGKFKLKDEITTRVNRFLLMGHVKDVYFTEFVIQ